MLYSLAINLDTCPVLVLHFAASVPIIVEVYLVSVLVFHLLFFEVITTSVMKGF